MKRDDIEEAARTADDVVIRADRAMPSAAQSRDRGLPGERFSQIRPESDEDEGK